MFSELGFRYVQWCDLAIVKLKIYSNYQWNKNSMVAISSFEPEYQMLKKTRIINVYVLSNEEIIAFDLPVQTYREEVIRKGFYIGHHFGKKSIFHQIDEETFVISSEDADRIIWSCLTKYILTIIADQEELLHLKAAAFAYQDAAYLVCGRGARGKTTFVETMCEQNEKILFLSNTHVLLDKGLNLFCIPSNIRYRQADDEVYMNLKDFTKEENFCGTLPVKGVFWIDYKDESQKHLQKLNTQIALNAMVHFSECVGNWELKEDIADYTKNIFEMSEFLSREKRRLEDFVKSTPFYYVTDIRNENMSNEVMLVLGKG